MNLIALQVKTTNDFQKNLEELKTCSLDNTDLYDSTIIPVRGQNKIIIKDSNHNQIYAFSISHFYTFYHVSTITFLFLFLLFPCLHFFFVYNVYIQVHNV